MTNDLTIFLFFNEKKTIEVLKRSIIFLNFTQNIFRFTFEGKEIKDKIYSRLFNDEIISDFFDIEIVNTKNIISLSIDYSKKPSDFFYCNLINSESYELLINNEELLFTLFKNNIDYITLIGHDRCLTSGIEEIYELYKRNIDLKTYSLFVIDHFPK